MVIIRFAAFSKVCQNVLEPRIFLILLFVISPVLNAIPCSDFLAGDDRRITGWPGHVGTYPIRFASEWNDLELWYKKLGFLQKKNDWVASEPGRAVTILNNFITSSVLSSQAIHWADTYVDESQQLRFVRHGFESPEGVERYLANYYTKFGKDEFGSSRFERSSPGISKDHPDLTDLIGALANGYWPGSLSQKDFSRIGLASSGPRFVEDLATLIRWYANEEMGVVRAAAHRVSQNMTRSIGRTIAHRMQYLFWFRPTLKSGAMEHLKLIIEHLNHAEFSDLKVFKHSIDFIEHDDLINVVAQLETWHSWYRGLNFEPGRLDRLLLNMKKSVVALRRQGTERNLHRIREDLAEFIFAAYALAEIDATEWIEFASSETVPDPDTGLFRYLCQGSNLDRDWKFFCYNRELLDIWYFPEKL